MLKKDPDRISKIASELGYSAEEKEKLICGRVGAGKSVDKREFLQRRLENEINFLYDRLTQALKEENERLRAENERLKNGN